VGFFDTVFPEPATLPEPLEIRHHATAPRGAVVPASLPLERVLARSHDRCVALTSVQVWPVNLTLEISVFATRAPRERDEFMVFPGSIMRREVDPNTRGLRFAVLFADGRYATNLRDPGFPREAARGLSPEFPVLTPFGGGGTGGAGGTWHATQRLDLWPLPRTGSVTLILDWPAEGIAEIRHQLDGAAFAEAARWTIDVWA
jgi:hypothetical protein